MTRPLHPCNERGCTALTSTSRCPEHTTDRYQRYRQVRPDDSFYHTSEWRRLRMTMLRYQSICQCGAQATVVDHITPIRMGGSPTDERNLQCLCASCHSRKSLKEARG